MIKHKTHFAVTQYKKVWIRNKQKLIVKILFMDIKFHLSHHVATKTSCDVVLDLENHENSMNYARHARDFHQTQKQNQYHTNDRCHFQHTKAPSAEYY